jgi:hypothetical protein
MVLLVVLLLVIDVVARTRRREGQQDRQGDDRRGHLGSLGEDLASSHIGISHRCLLLLSGHPHALPPPLLFQADEVIQ